jgi:hypothetical protein
MIVLLHLLRLFGTVVLIVAVYRGSQLALVCVLVLLLLAQEAQALLLYRGRHAARDLFRLLQRQQQYPGGRAGGPVSDGPQ